MLPLQLILKKYLGIMSEINDDKYLKSLVNTENNNNQYKLAKTENNNSESAGSDTKLSGGVIQSQPPMSLKEIYEQQKKAGLNSSSIKHISMSGAGSESTKKPGINIVIPPNPTKLMPHFKNNDSDSSQPYHKQEGGIEEEFSNMASNKKNYKPELDTVSEGKSATSASTLSVKKNIFNFRGY